MSASKIGNTKESSGNVKIASSPFNWYSDSMSLPQSYKPTADEYLKSLNDTGFTGTALGAGNVLPLEPDKLNYLLATYNITLAEGFWVTHLLIKPLDEQMREFEMIVKTLKAMNGKNLVIADFSRAITSSLTKPLTETSSLKLSPQDWKILTEGLSRMIQCADENDIALSYHPHVGTIIQNLANIRTLLDYIPNMKLTADFGHLAFAGVEFMPFLEKYNDIIIHYHLKNIDFGVAKQVKMDGLPWIWSKLNGLFTAIGNGGLDYESILKYLVKIGYEGWVVVELESSVFTSNPYTYSKLSYDYVVEITDWT